MDAKKDFAGLLLFMLNIFLDKRNALKEAILLQAPTLILYFAYIHSS